MQGLSKNTGDCYNVLITFLNKTMKIVSVSVVTPALNEVDNLRLYFNALSNQTFLPKEIIVVDHNSQDKTYKVATSFISRFKSLGVNLKVLQEKKPGIANARNTGWFKATQPIIASIDMDCRPDKYWIETIWKCFQNDKEISAITGKVIMPDGPFIVKLLTYLDWYRLLFYFLKVLYGFPHFPTSNVAVKKDVFVKVGGFDRNIKSINDLDDIDLSSRISLSHKIRYCSRMIITTSFRRYKRGNALKTYLHRYKRLLEIAKRFKRIKTKKA